MAKVLGRVGGLLCWHGTGGLARAGALGLMLWGLVATAATAMTAPDPADLCEQAAAIAGAEAGVPRAYLQAIALTETGRSRDGARRPWPWALNLGGPGFWFDTRAEAEARLEREIRAGRRNIDVGCFQLNLHWHGAAFASPAAMFDPLQNARYAAGFLRELHDEFGDWMAAVGAYHSRTPERAARYRDLFAMNLASLRGMPPVRPGQDGFGKVALGAPEALPAMVSPLPRAPRVNTFPLLQAGAPGSAGSLVPQAMLAEGGLFSAPRRGIGQQR